MNYIAIVCVLICSTNSRTVIGPNLNDDHSSNCGTRNNIFYNHTPFSYIIEESNLCSGEVYILNYVQSSSDHFDRRMLIRESWGSMRYIDTDPVRLLFVIGRSNSLSIQQQIEYESLHYRDIVQADFRDTYRNLTIKHIVALHWVHTFCSQAKFISKTDDDTFINIFALREYVKGYLDSRKPIILGQIFKNEIPIRVKGYKWTVSKDMYEHTKYPPFTKGFGYVISQSAVEPLFVCSYYVKFLYIDDVFITGLVAQKGNLILKNFENHYGYAILKNKSVLSEIVNNIFYVGQNVVVQSQWQQLWKFTLKYTM